MFCKSAESHTHHVNNTCGGDSRVQPPSAIDLFAIYNCSKKRDTTTKKIKSKNGNMTFHISFPKKETLDDLYGKLINLEFLYCSDYISLDAWIKKVRSLGFKIIALQHKMVVEYAPE